MGVDDPDLLDDLTSRAESSFTVKRGEDAWSHRRQVTPGDHRDKLKPETISRLNGVFREALEALRYPS
jgi:hypothetical protein